MQRKLNFYSQGCRPFQHPLPFYSVLPRRVISMHRVANFHNVMEIWEPGKQVVGLSTWQRENGNRAHSHHCVLLDSFPFCRSALLGLVMNHRRSMKHKHSATSGLLRRLRCDWNFVVRGKTVSGRKEERQRFGQNVANQTIYFPFFLLSFWRYVADERVEIFHTWKKNQNKTQKYACLLFGQCLKHFIQSSVECKTGCIKTEWNWETGEKSSALLLVPFGV